jgi:hypothetical protein
MYERLGPEAIRSTKQKLTVKEEDRLFVGYLNIKGEIAEQEPEKWANSSLEDQRWLTAEALLKGNKPPPLMNVQLSYVGMSLADFVPPMYNDQQVARDSDGP